MIKYKLVCKNCDISFDSWFASSKEFENLKKKNLLLATLVTQLKLKKL